MPSKRKPGTTEKATDVVPPSLRKPTFFEQYALPSDADLKAEMSWNELDAIWNDHASCISELNSVGQYVVARLQAVEKVHSIRSRVKDPDHLIAKIIRKRIEDPKRIYTLANYKAQVTDLIGVRALHLFKEDWHTLHEFITTTWKRHEKPTANIRAGDSPAYIAEFRNSGCKVKLHKSGYRSVHYLIESRPEQSPFIVELQVRTVFEEGWSEIDHQVRYPHEIDDPMVALQLGLLNRLAGAADEMGSFVIELHKQRKADKDRELLLRKNIAALEKMVNDLEINKRDKQSLTEVLSSFPAPPPANSVAELVSRMMVPDLSSILAAQRFTSSVAATRAMLDQGSLGVAKKLAALEAAKKIATADHILKANDNISKLKNALPSVSIGMSYPSPSTNKIQQRCSKCGKVIRPGKDHDCVLAEPNGQ